MPTCPVCHYPGLDESPRSPGGGGSYEICPSCGFQFGVDDDDKGITHEEWRARWIEKGLTWSSRGIAMPKDWDAKAQLTTETNPVRKVGGRKPAAKAPAKATKTAKTAKKKSTRRKR